MRRRRGRADSGRERDSSLRDGDQDDAGALGGRRRRRAAPLPARPERPAGGAWEQPRARRGPGERAEAADVGLD